VGRGSRRRRGSRRSTPPRSPTAGCCGPLGNTLRRQGPAASRAAGARFSASAPFVGAQCTAPLHHVTVWRDLRALAARRGAIHRAPTESKRPQLAVLHHSLHEVEPSLPQLGQNATTHTTSILQPVALRVPWRCPWLEAGCALGGILLACSADTSSAKGLRHSSLVIPKPRASAEPVPSQREGRDLPGWGRSLVASLLGMTSLWECSCRPRLESSAVPGGRAAGSARVAPSRSLRAGGERAIMTGGDA